MALTVSVSQAKTNLPKLLALVAMGEEVVIAKAGKPVARIVPFMERPKERIPGTAKGKVWIAPDFDAPLPDSILDEFENTV